jgi:hypothetical protein
MILTVGEERILLNKKSNIIYPLGAVSPDPKCPIGPGVGERNLLSMAEVCTTKMFYF